MTRPQPGTRADYTAFETIQTRWNDNDQYGHIYNVTYYELFDSAMNNWMMPRGMLDHTTGEPLVYTVENGCNYFSQISYPEPAEIGMRLSHIGTSSARVDMGLFRPGHDSESARAYFVMVCVDADTRRPVPFPDKQRRALSELAPPA